MIMSRFLSIVAAVCALCISSIAHADLTDKLRPDAGKSFPQHPLPECQLPELGEAIEALTVEGHTPNRLELPPLYGLVLLSMTVDSYDDGELIFAVDRLPLLPDGGLRPIDLCGPLETQRMRVPAVGDRAGIIGLRMRPSLDLAAAYPTFGAGLAESSRAVRTKPKTFAAFKTFPNDEKILRDALLDHPMIESDRNIWTMPGLILLPLAE